MEDDITFNCVLIVESLPATEPQTGKILHDYVSGLLSESNIGPEAKHVRLESADAFIGLIGEVTRAAVADDLLPILHIEAHGSEDEGIVFADGSVLPWTDFCDLITPLNVATNLKLVVVVAACYGADLLTGVRLSKPSPCFGFIAPTLKINVGEVIGRFRDMYRAMLTTLDAGRTFEAMQKQRLDEGTIIPHTANHWFELLTTKYLDEQFTSRYIEQLATRQYLKFKREGIPASLKALKVQTRNGLANVLRGYFTTYFMLNERPENERRFRALRARLEDRLGAAMRRSS